MVDGDRSFLSAVYDGSYMLRLKEDGLGIKTIWQRKGRNERRTDALHAINSTPILWKDEVYGAVSYGEFRGLDAATGQLGEYILVDHVQHRRKRITRTS